MISGCSIVYFSSAILCIKVLQNTGGYYLYSNNVFLGKNTYNYYFHNQGGGTLEIRMKNRANNATLKTHFVNSGKTVSSSLSMTDKNSRFYFEFYGTKSYVFSGYVK